MEDAINGIISKLITEWLDCNVGTVAKPLSLLMPATNLKTMGISA